MGANPDVTVDDVVRFAQMGAAYARVVWTLSIRVWACFQRHRGREGLQLYQGVLPGHEGRGSRLCGQLRGHRSLRRAILMSLPPTVCRAILRSRPPRALPSFCCRSSRVPCSSLGTKIAALLIKRQMRQIKAKLSGDAKGGAILLGLRGVVLLATVPRRSRPSRTVRCRGPGRARRACPGRCQFYGRYRFIKAALRGSTCTAWGRIGAVLQRGSDCRVVLCSMTYERKRYGSLRNLR